VDEHRAQAEYISRRARVFEEKIELQAVGSDFDFVRRQHGATGGDFVKLRATFQRQGKVWLHRADLKSPGRSVLEQRRTAVHAHRQNKLNGLVMHNRPRAALERRMCRRCDDDQCIENQGEKHRPLHSNDFKRVLQLAFLVWRMGLKLFMSTALLTEHFNPAINPPMEKQSLHQPIAAPLQRHRLVVTRTALTR
jgi:hypothetical protein